MSVKNKKQAGFGAVPIIVAVLVLAGLGLIGWRLYSSSNKMAAQKTTTTQTSGSNQTSSSSQQQQTDPNAGYVVIKEWGVRFKPVGGLTNVIYAFGSTAQVVNFSTDGLKTLDPSCDPGKYPAIGGIERTTNPYSDAQGPHPQSLGMVGGYYYYYDSQQSTCSNSKSVQDTEIQQIALLKQSILSFEAAK